MMDWAREEKREEGVVRQSVEPCCTYNEGKVSKENEGGREERETNGETVPNVHHADIESVARELEDAFSSSSTEDTMVVPARS
jgi:hypothetical protein